MQAKKKNKKKVFKKVKPFIIQDDFFHKAKREGYRARSAYKLLEIQEKFDLIKADMNICDIGAAPGSFLQVVRKIVGESGIIVGIDLQDIKHFSQKNIITLKHDIFDFENLKPKLDEIIGIDKKFDLITSDIAPKTTGRKDVDQYASVELNIEIVKFSDIFLKTGGNLILKVFKGEDFNDLTMVVKKYFKSMKTFKPKACRDRSFEEYVICLGKK